jgi:threonine dehydratase
MTVSREAVEEAAGRIGPHVRHTPIVEVRPGMLAKLELLQHTGSFKARGAFNRLLSEPVIPTAGVITASGGNHGQALAYAAHHLGIPAEVFVPEVTPPLKRHRIEGWGARLVVEGAQYPDALAASRLRATETGALEIHAYDHPATVAGQGTMAREIEYDLPEVDSVVIAVGGGGLAAGAAAWFGTRVKLVAVEPRGSRALNAALEAGHPVEVAIDSVAADSLGARSVGAVPFETISAGRVTSVLVSDDDIVRAQRWLWDELRLITEPGGAAATAAVLSGAYLPTEGERLVVVVCGANTDPSGMA